MMMMMIVYNEISREKYLSIYNRALRTRVKPHHIIIDKIEIERERENSNMC